jgi:cbb3-type cytochrome oxidase cytochrome c subunit
MNRGPLLFLGAFFALSLSWFGLILTPQLQIGSQNPGEASDLGYRYPAPRSGDAHAGREVYRAAGCVYCHSQQVGQNGVIFDVALTKAGIFTDDVANAILRINSDLGRAVVNNGVGNTNGFIFMRDVDFRTADHAMKRVNEVGGNVETALIPKPTGRDINLGWGARRSVARDYLYDYPVQLGGQRIGPDLTNIGNRRPDAEWHYKHLYSPKSVLPKSAMPAYEYLFKEVSQGSGPSADAVSVEVDGTEQLVEPTEKGRQLVAYLLSLRSGPRLFETPMPKQSKPASATAGGAELADAQ